MFHGIGCLIRTVAFLWHHRCVAFRSTANLLASYWMDAKKFKHQDTQKNKTAAYKARQAQLNCYVSSITALPLN